MKYSLQWIINLKQNQLQQFEFEISRVNTEINTLTEAQRKNRETIQKIQRTLHTFKTAFEISSAIKNIEYLEKQQKTLEEKAFFLNKEKTMLVEKYKNKHTEIKLLEKNKSKVLEENKKKRAKKNEDEINELSLIKRRDT